MYYYLLLSKKANCPIQFLTYYSPNKDFARKKKSNRSSRSPQNTQNPVPYQSINHTALDNPIKNNTALRSQINRGRIIPYCRAFHGYDIWIQFATTNRISLIRTRNTGDLSERPGCLRPPLFDLFNFGDRQIYCVDTRA